MNPLSLSPLPQSFSCEMSSFCQDNVWDSVTVNRHSVSSQMVVMGEALHAEKANSYRE